MTQRQEDRYLALGSWGLFGILALLAHFRFAILTQVDQWGLNHLNLTANDSGWLQRIATMGSTLGH